MVGLHFEAFYIIQALVIHRPRYLHARCLSDDTSCELLTHYECLDHDPSSM